MTDLEPGESLRGRLVIAAGGLFDPNFRQTVVLVTEHNEEGAVGLVLNRPADVSLREAVPALAGLSPDDVIYHGGPVQPQAALVLAEFERPELADRPAFAAVGMLDP